MSERSSLSILANLGSKLAIPKIQESLKNIITGKEGTGIMKALSTTLYAKSDSWSAATGNIRKAIEALETAESALLEIATLATRLEELRRAL